MLGFAIEIIQSICLIIAAIIILITAFGILRLDDGMEKVIYVRIHMLGMVDIACVLAMIGLGQYLLAGLYFILAPFVAHAMANAYYFGEDDRKYETNDELTGRVNDNLYTELALNNNTKIDAEFKSNIVSYTKSEEFKGLISDKRDVVIKEVTTDDIENSNLSKYKDNKYNKDINAIDNDNKEYNDNNDNSNNKDNNMDNRNKDEEGGEKHD